MDKVKITIIGAGVVGLAIAAKLSEKYQDIVLIEKYDSFGQETSSRNSEIIHAGIYYPKDSLKAKLCLEGKTLLYSFCQQNNIPHKKLGKIIVAIKDEEIVDLEQLKVKAEDNGVLDLEWFDQKQIQEYEPAVKGVKALYSPSTGIVDSHSLMKCLENKAKERGVMISYVSEVVGIEKVANGYKLNINNEYDFESEIIINAAGLSSDKIAKMAGIDKYKLYYCKGEYFSYTKKSFIKRLVYPVPEKDDKALGVHSVIDLNGDLKFGPSAFYVDKLDYKVDKNNRKAFHESVASLFPQIKIEDLQPDQSGIRPKLQGPGDPVKDFVIAKDLPGLINLVGIESPGLTACLAIAQYVQNLVE